MANLLSNGYTLPANVRVQVCMVATGCFKLTDRSSGLYLPDIVYRLSTNILITKQIPEWNDEGTRSPEEMVLITQSMKEVNPDHEYLCRYRPQRSPVETCMGSSGYLI